MVSRKTKNRIFKATGRLGTCAVEETVVIAGVPRAGTTWMLELLRHLPGYKALNEPLMYEEARREHGFGWHKHLAPGTEAPVQRRYLERVLTGRLGVSPAWFFEADARPTQLLEHATRDRLVVKFCRLNRMLHWFADQFAVRGIVLVVRHPCAVVASMLRHGAWEEDKLHGGSRRAQALHGGVLPETLRDPFGPVLNRLSTRVGVLATHWCLDHYIPLIQHANGTYPWILAPYERLLTRGRRELVRITDALDVERTESMAKQLREPSSSVEDPVRPDVERQLSKWRRHLSDEQIERILEVVDTVGLSSLYTGALEPDYDRLNSYQQPSARW
jgi:hypothetical protein